MAKAKKMAPKTRQAPSAKTKLKRAKKYISSKKDNRKGFKKSFAEKIEEESVKSGNIARMIALPLETIAKKNIALAEAYIKYYKNKKKNGKKEK